MKKTFTISAVILLAFASFAAQASDPRPDPRVTSCEWTTHEVESINLRLGANYRTLLLYEHRLDAGDIRDLGDLVTMVAVLSDYTKDLTRWGPRVLRVADALSWECSDYPGRAETAELADTLAAGLNQYQQEILKLSQATRIAIEMSGL